MALPLIPWRLREEAQPGSNHLSETWKLAGS